MTVADLDRELKLGLAGETRWFRAGVARGIAEPASSVDREQGVIRNYSVITKGPALGHGLDVDETTLDQVVDLGNRSKLGIKSRFDHPNASNTSMGTFVGRTMNFRRVGDRVLGDLHLSESAKVSPQGNLHEYILSLAEEDPAAFGASIVFTGKPEQLLDDNGKPLRGDDGKVLPDRARVDALLASDVVDDPAANPDGLFSSETSLASKLSAFLNRWAQQDLLPAIFSTLEVSMDTAAADLEKVKEDGRKQGQADERTRVTGIHKAFASVWGNDAPEAERTVRDGLIELGTSVEDATTAFKTRKLTQLTVAAPPSAGGGRGDHVIASADLSPSIPSYEQEWTRDQKLKEEFGTFEVYKHFRQAEDAGRIKVFTKEG